MAAITRKFGVEVTIPDDYESSETLEQSFGGELSKAYRNRKLRDGMRNAMADSLGSALGGLSE